MAPQTREEFEALININYINILGSDQDNSIKLAAFKDSSVVKDRIDTLYKLYNFMPVDPIILTTDLDTLLKEFEKIAEDATKEPDDLTDAEVFGSRTEELKDILNNKFKL